MSQFKKIIVATDFSDPSIEALREADLISHRTGAKLVVFHAIPNVIRTNPLFPQKNIEDYFQLPQLMDRAAGAVEELIDEYISDESPKEGESEVTDDTGDHAYRQDRSSARRVSVVVDTGWPDTTLMRQAEELGADLIVVGSRGFTGLKHVLLGSVAERVVRYAHCAVLVARASSRAGHILAAMDFSDPSLPAIEAASKIAQRRGAKLTVIHSLGASSSLALASSPFGGGPIVPDKNAIAEARGVAEEMLEAALARFGVEGSVVVGEGMPEDDILRCAARLPAEMVVLGSIGRSKLNRVVLGSVAETVARTATCSVLVVR